MSNLFGQNQKKKKLSVAYKPKTTENDSSALFRENSEACRQTNVCIMGDFNFNNNDLEYLTGDTEAEPFIKTVS